MTRRDFELIAEVLRETRWAMDNQSFQQIAGAFAIRLLDENPRFDYERFLDACGIPDEES